MLCQSVNLIEQFLLFGRVNQRAFLINLEVVVVRLGHNADIRASFFRNPNELAFRRL